MFYEFRQNNSGGSFHFDKEAGISTSVIIEADNMQEAIDKAKSIGLYFKGVERGIDCECCGDRWREPFLDAGKEVPCDYDTPLELNKKFEKNDKEFHYKRLEDGVPDFFIHYKDGRIVGTWF